jgi:flagellar basal body P-ring formation protein FlgA
MTIRSLLLGTTLSVSLLCGTAFAEGLRLRTEAIVEGDTVQLGQLIEGLERGAEIPVFRAPAPGAHGSIRADRVIAAAREMGIKGADKIVLSGVNTIRILRPGRVVTRSNMQDAVAHAFSERGARGDVEVTLDDHLQPHTFDLARTEAIRVKSLNHDPATGRFEARIALSSDVTGDSWAVTGSLVETREIAVAASDLDRGDAVQARDLTLVKRRANTVPSDVITSFEDLVGMVPRRPLRAGEPIRQADLAKPILVEKNQIVTVIYASGGLTLQMRGRVQGNGSKGDTVRVQNLQSKRIVEGIVTGLAQVSILTAPPIQPKLADAGTPVRR